MEMATVNGTAERTAPAPTQAGELTTRFGRMPVVDHRQIVFQGGLPGFPKLERFQLLPLPDAAADFLLLQSVDAAEVAFIVIALPQDLPLIRSEDIGEASRMLDIAAGDLLLLGIVSLQRTPEGVAKYINLRAPLFVDVHRRTGAQVVLGSADYPLRYRLPEAA